MSCFSLLPPSLHNSGSHYEFANETPVIKPLNIDLVNLHKLLVKYCGNKSKNKNELLSKFNYVLFKPDENIVGREIKIH